MKNAPSSAAIALMAASACGPTAQAVRPADPNSSAVGEKTCVVPEDPNSPLAVDLKPYQRDALELAMQEGVAVVTYDCDELRLLPGCHVDGNYEYKPTSSQRRVIHLRNLDEIRASLPTSGSSLGENLEADLKRGATLDIVLQTAGRVVTNRSSVSRSLLRGECEGATHIVRGATIGAFSMSTSTLGQVGGSVGVVSGNGSSEKTVDMSSGDMEACKETTTDGKPPAKCSTPIRLHLEEIGDNETNTDSGQDLSAPAEDGKNEQSYSARNTFSLGARGFYRTGEAEGYEGNSSINGAMVVGEYRPSDHFGILAGGGMAGLRAQSTVGTEKEDDGRVFTGLIGATVVTHPTAVVSPVLELDGTFQGGLGVQGGAGLATSPQSLVSFRLMGFAGRWATGRKAATNLDGKPTYQLTVPGYSIDGSLIFNF